TGNANFSEPLEKAAQAKDIFGRFGAVCETELIDLQIAKFLIKTDRLDEAEALIDANIKHAEAASHLYSRAQFLHKRGVMLSEKSEFIGSIQSLEKSIQSAGSLDVPDFLLQPTIILARISYLSDDNQQAFYLAYKALRDAYSLNNRALPMQLTQVLGVSAFNLNRHSLSEMYLRQSILLAEKQENLPYQASSLSFLGIIEAEQKRFSEAEEDFNKADRLVDKIEDEQAHDSAEFNISGYKARSQMMAGNAERAIELFQRA